MEFTIGSIVFLSSMLLLVILARLSASKPDTAVLRGDILPAMLAVLISSGLAIGPLIMAMAGVAYFPSRSIVLAGIALFIIVSVWTIARLVSRGQRGVPA